MKILKSVNFTKLADRLESLPNQVSGHNQTPELRQALKDAFEPLV
jgi:hypothetical protein